MSTAGVGDPLAIQGIEREVPREGVRSSIAGQDEEVSEGWRLSKFPGQSMLSATGTDNQNVHGGAITPTRWFLVVCS